MTSICRTCGYEMEHGRPLFHKEGTEVLHNILRLTGVLFEDHPGVPTKICMPCLLVLNEAIAFRERCITTNNSWFCDQDTKEYSDDQMEEGTFSEVLREKVVLKSTFQQPKSPVPEEIPPEPSKEPDRISSMAIEEPIFHLTVDIVDPLRCEDPIEVKCELLPLDEDPDESINKNLIKEESRKVEVIEEQSENQVLEEVTHVIRKRRGRPKDSRSKEEKNDRRRKLAAERRAETKDQKLYFCDQCGKTFSEKGNFNVHLTRHKGTKEFQCSECDRREFTQHLLNLHVRIKHRGELPYECKYCGQRFDNCLKRLFHERRHKENPNQRPHECPICKKGFKSTTSLKHHSVVHTGEQPFYCELCQTHFNRRNSLRTHYKSKQHINKVEEQAQMLNVESQTGPEDGDYLQPVSKSTTC
ncbi:transcription factor Ouib-like [Drosophila subpulchrella]|uniref:transcription factor Ouib-like n=1 Tax=Drosophila subpulchrella TaxID=1486046 RepID=UPI0018A1ABDB|nr:transcription factor Ouib-like [Drosophila subpulchrella]